MLELGFNLNQVCVRMESRYFPTSVPVWDCQSESDLRLQQLGFPNLKVHWVSF